MWTGSVTPTNSLKITAKQKCKSSNIINEGFYFSGTSLDHNVTPAWTEAWEEQSWLSVTVINDLAHPPHVGGSSLITTSVPASNVSNLWLPVSCAAAQFITSHERIDGAE